MGHRDGHVGQSVRGAASPARDHRRLGCRRARQEGRRENRSRARLHRRGRAPLYGCRSLDQRARTLAYEQAMEQIYKTYPKDLEAAAFYALAVDQTAPPTDKTYANQLKAGAILEQLFQRSPIIRASRTTSFTATTCRRWRRAALAAARRYADIAPAAPHALHMPSHTFTRVGAWQESIDTNIRVGRGGAQDEGTGEELHAMDYMVYAYLQTGQDAAAQAACSELARDCRRLRPATRRARRRAAAGRVLRARRDSGALGARAPRLGGCRALDGAGRATCRTPRR